MRTMAGAVIPVLRLMDHMSVHVKMVMNCSEKMDTMVFTQKLQRQVSWREIYIVLTTHVFVSSAGHGEFDHLLCQGVF